MSIVELLKKELAYESMITRKFLERVPEDKWDWKPHEKSMNLKSLTVHLAELPGWISMALHTDELDFAAAPYQPTEVSTRAELVAIFDKALESGTTALNAATEADMKPKWTLRSGEHIHMVMNKYEVIRHSLNQTTHHRAQLGVYLRLLDIPIPGSYGPSADETEF
ncbi:MAG TPA: DinB family protein [Flavisolibacter sp.]|nr:DinB family protein [Flavisolibacter sp.]